MYKNPFDQFDEDRQQPGVVAFGAPKPAPQPSPQTAAQARLDEYQARAGALSPAQAGASLHGQNLTNQEHDYKVKSQPTYDRFNARDKLLDNYRADKRINSFEGALPVWSSGLRAPGTPEGDTLLTNVYAKVMDPMTGVQAGESAAIQGNSPTPEQIRIKMGKLFGTDANGNFTPEGRQRIKEAVTVRMRELGDSYRQARQYWETQIKDSGIPDLDPQTILGRHAGLDYQQAEEQFLGRPIRAPGEHMDATQRQAMTPQAQMQLSNGTTKAQADPMREAINKRLGAMMTRGVSDDKIRDYAAKVGVDPASLTGALQFRRTPGFQQWKRQNPNTAYPVIDPGANVQTSGLERTVAETAASPLGSGIGHSANAMLAGNIPTLAGAFGGDANRARLNLQTMAEANPKASLAGDIAGTAGAYAGANAALGGLGGSAAGRFIPQFIKETPEVYNALNGRALLGDAAYGAANGYGSTGNAMGALEGGVAGVAGGVAGRGVPRTIGGTIAPTGGKAAQLYEMGVRPSPGQRAGGILNNVEQRMQDVPVFGDFIRGTRQRARDQFEHGVYNDALKEIGEQLPKGTRLGTHAQAYMQNAFNKAYDKARSGMAFVADDEFNQGVTQLIANAKAGGLDSAGAKRLDNIYKGQVLRRAEGGVASGNTYKTMSSQLGKIAAGAQDQEFKGAVRELGDLVDQAARRHSPKEAVAAMDAADAGYAKAVRIEDAAKRRGTDTGRFTPNQYDAAVQNMSSGVRSRDYLAGRALNTDVAQSGKMLSDTISDSGTPQRMLNAMGASAVAGGAAYAHPATLGVLGTVGAAYAPGMRNLTTGAMAPRASEAAKKFGGFFRGRRVNRYSGTGGADFADWLEEQRQR